MSTNSPADARSSPTAAMTISSRPPPSAPMDELGGDGGWPELRDRHSGSAKPAARRRGADWYPMNLGGTGRPAHAAGFSAKWTRQIAWGNTDAGSSSVNSEFEPYEQSLTLPLANEAPSGPQALSYWDKLLRSLSLEAGMETCRVPPRCLVARPQEGRDLWLSGHPGYQRRRDSPGLHRARANQWLRALVLQLYLRWRNRCLGRRQRRHRRLRPGRQETRRIRWP